MGLAALFKPVLGTIVSKGLDIIDDLVPDKDLAAKLKAAFKHKILDQDHSEIMALIQGRVEIILAEAKGGILQRNWRPILMLTIVFIVANNYVIYPYISLFGGPAIVLELPDRLWSLMMIGLGGYVTGRSAEKIVQNLKGKEK